MEGRVLISEMMQMRGTELMFLNKVLGTSDLILAIVLVCGGIFFFLS